MKLSDDLAWRGLIKDKTFANISWLDKPRTFYLGIDASSDSLTIGNLAVLMLARRLAEAGWQTILLAGGATSLVGDPGGKKAERQLQDRITIFKNADKIKKQMDKLFGSQRHEMVNNVDWLADLKLLEFLRDTGKHFSMTELMQRDFVDERMGKQGSGISYAEFSYSLLQGYDYWWLHKHKQAELQIGASDQWGNMLSGVALVRKKEGKQVHAMSMPLVLNKQTGQKFGKSEASAIWLDPARTRPTQFYQFWINADDSDTEEYLKIFTLFTKDQIERIMIKHKADPSKREAQKSLAQEVTKIVHGSAGTAADITKYLTSDASIEDASENELESIRQEVGGLSAAPGGSITDLLSASRLASSNSEARRLLQDGAVYINGQKINRNKIEQSDFVNGRFLLRRGKAHKDTILIERS